MAKSNDWTDVAWGRTTPPPIEDTFEADDWRGNDIFDNCRVRINGVCRDHAEKDGKIVTHLTKKNDEWRVVEEGGMPMYIGGGAVVIILIILLLILIF